MVMKLGEFDDFIIELWDRFDERLEDAGYKVSSYNDANMGRGTTAFKEDRYVPIIKLSVHDMEDIIKNSSSLTVFIDDRKGNKVITGDTVEIAQLELGVSSDKEDIRLRFEHMIDDMLYLYAKYNKDNRMEYDDEILRTSY